MQILPQNFGRSAQPLPQHYCDFEIPWVSDDLPPITTIDEKAALNVGCIACKNASDWTTASIAYAIPGIGTGGWGIPAEWQRNVDGFTSFGIVVRGKGPVQPDATGVPTMDMLALVRSSFGLGVAALARALRVQRPTVYAWLRDEAQPRRANAGRLAQLYRLARRWAEVSNEPLMPLAKVSNASGRLNELLNAKVIDEALLSQHFDLIRNSATPQKTRWPGARALADNHDIPVPKVGNEQSLDWITGRRSSWE